MIKTFCDCCGDQIPSSFTEEENKTHFPVKRVSISQNKHWNNDFLVELIVTANIYEPDNLLDKCEEDRLRGHNICKKCIVEALTQKER